MKTILLFPVVLLLCIACDRDKKGGASNGGKAGAGKEVVVYTSVDAEVAQPIIKAFIDKTGIKVLLKTDTEASKTAGLVQLLRAEKSNPQADVFWNNEIFHTINLAEEGVLAAYESPSVADVAQQFKDPAHKWAANAWRMRMIASGLGIHIEKVEDFTDPRFKGKTCMGFPALGTIAGQVASWHVEWGPEKTEKFLRDLKANQIKLVGGNSEVVKLVGQGTLYAGLTDNDDIDSALREGGRLKGVPARTENNGALVIPVTVGLVSGAKHAEVAKKVIDYLLSKEVEDKLIEAGYAKGSVRGQLAPDVMKIDYRQAAKAMPKAVESARRILEGRE